ncbi:MAG: SIR2 family protein [Rhizobiaceae bacterium]
MKIKSYTTKRAWLDQMPPVNPQAEGAEIEGKQPDIALEEINRVLSDVIRAHKLIVLTGLGTSLCVKNPAGQNKAPTMRDLWNAVKHEYEQPGDAARPTWNEVLEIARQPENNENIEELLSRCKSAEGFENGDRQTKILRFISDAERVIRTKVDFLDQSEPLDLHEVFLRKLGRRSNRRERLKLFTTNYDRCFEHAAQRTGFVVMDGFTLAQPAIFEPMHFSYDVVRRGHNADTPDYIENLFQLYKIHGSIDWEINEQTKQIVRNAKTEKPLLIYPRNSKYELAFAQPYLEMISSFQSALRGSDTAVLIVGFGFNDNHLAEPILAAIETNLSLKVVVVSPGIEAQSATNPHLKKIAGLIDRGDARLALLAASFEELVPIIPDIAAQTDLERHIERVRAVRER